VRFDPDLILVFGGFFLLIVGYNLSRAFARRSEARAVSNGDVAEIRRRLEAIERAVDSIAIEVERASEAQRFTAKILSEKAPALPRAPD
jgi:hypothetical protein